MRNENGTYELAVCQFIILLLLQRAVFSGVV